MLISFCDLVLAQNTKQPPTIKESVKEVKTSAKAIGDLFKKKKITDTAAKEKVVAINAPSALPAKSEKITLSDSTLDKIIIDLILAELIADNKKDKPKLTKSETESYAEYQFDFGDGISSSYYFSKLKRDHVLGDLNLDGMEDVMVKLSSNSGGNTDYLHLFIFLKQASGWKLALIKEAADEAIKGCKIGSFMPMQIEKGFVFGESSCFTEADPRCCPSLKIKTTLKWENNDLQLFKKVKL